MVKAWYINSERNGRYFSNDKGPLKFISVVELYKKTGVEYFKLNVDTYKTDGILDRIIKERGYSREDEMVCSKESLHYEEMSKTFATEHLHTDEEIRLFLDGCGYFDVRDCCDRWVRIEISAGDMIVLPAGIYHRFTFGPDSYIKQRRFFSEEPVWQAYYRPADDMVCRRRYVERLRKGFLAAH